MSDFTTTFRWICENESIGQELTVDQKIQLGRLVIFDFDYPIWDAAYKPTLETKIIKHYYMQEFGAETFGLMRLWMNDKLNLIMPYYNELYNTTLKEFDYLKDVNYTVTHDGTKNEDATGNLKSDTENKQNVNESITQNNIFDSDTKNFDFPQAIGTGDYQDTSNTVHSTDANTSSRFTDSDATGNLNTDTTNNKDTVDHYIDTYLGAWRQAPVDLLKKYREQILNIDNLIVQEFKDLFMGIFNGGF